MSDDERLEAFRLADSFLPVGTYTVSYGVEQFVQSDRITDGSELRTLLETYLVRQLAAAELVVLRAAHAAASDGDVDAVCEADSRLSAVTLTTEFRESATRSGKQLLGLQCDLQSSSLLESYATRVDVDDAPGNYPAVLGVVTALADVSVRQACLLSCHCFVTGVLGAAQRLMAIGHTEVQRILSALQPAMTTAVDASEGRTLDEMDPFTPVIDVVSCEHERAERRLFLS